jgi:hypothetical protein
MDNEIVKEGNGVPLREFLDALFLHLLGNEKRMLALREIVAAHLLQRFLRLVDFPADILWVKIDRDGVVEKRQRGERPKDDPRSSPGI